MTCIDVKILKLNEKAILPVYQTAQAAGMDIHACIDQPITINPMQRVMIPTGLAIELPVDYEMQIRARSSLGLKFGVTLINGVGTIDSDFRGEFCVSLINLGDSPFVVEPEMRIAQAVVAKHEHVVWNEVNSLNEEPIVL